MKKKNTQSTRKLAIHKESLRNLTGGKPIGGGGLNTAQSICVGCTSEYTWYCPTASGCSNCPICNAVD